MASHPYFINKDKSKVAKKYDENGNELFWDGFQWVPRQTQRSYFNPMQELFIQKVAEVSGANRETNLERVANSKTVIVDNIPLDLGLTSKELHAFFV